MKDQDEKATALLSTIAEGCSILKIGRTHFYSAIQRGEVRVIKLGRSVRIPRSEIERIAREGW
jgi:excisionase family DNA binding protein